MAKSARNKSFRQVAALELRDFSKVLSVHAFSRQLVMATSSFDLSVTCSRWWW